MYDNTHEQRRYAEKIFFFEEEEEKNTILFCSQSKMVCVKS